MMPIVYLTSVFVPQVHPQRSKDEKSRFAAREEDWRRWANAGRSLGNASRGGRGREANQFEVPGRPWEDERKPEEKEEEGWKRKRGLCSFGEWRQIVGG